MRVVYYTHAALFEPALCLIRELGRRVELHVLLELGPSAWQTAGFDLHRRELTPGLMPAEAILTETFPPGVRAYWETARSFHFVVHSSRRSLHPASWRVSRRALRFSAQLGAEVLHVDDVDVSPRLALAMPGGPRVPLVISVHDPQIHSGEANWRKQLARRLAFPAARRIVLFNAASREPFARRHGIPSSAIDVTHLGPYGVFREWPVTAEHRPRTVLFFGRLSPYKGLEVFYDAVRLLAVRVPNVHVVVAGRAVDGYVPPTAPLLPSPGSIEVHGHYLSNSETVRLFRSAAVVACPYRDATQSGVVLTAFALGVPVVAAAVGGMPEYVVSGESGILVPPNDAPALAAALERALTEPQLVAELQRGMAVASESTLNWGSTADALLETYRRARISG